MEVDNGIDCLCELYYYNLTTPAEIVLTTKELWYPVCCLQEGLLQCFYYDATAGTMTVKYDGKYLFQGTATIFPSAGAIIEFGLFINDILQENVVSAISFKNNQDRKTFSGSGIVRLRTGDVVQVKGWSDTDLITLSVVNFNITLHRTDMYDISNS